MELAPELQEKKRLMIDGLKKTYKVQYDAVQPIPYIKDRLYCVDKVFVEGGVEVCLPSELTRDTGGSWERLESYKNIYTDFHLNFKRRIIQGEPGYGKSTLTLQLAYDWCNEVLNSSMRNVEILILLRLRQLGGIQSIYRAIKLFLLDHERRVTVDDIHKIIRSCSSVNIILDGYDEYPDRDSGTDNDVDKMIMKELLRKVDVTVTTRYLPKRLIKETKRAKLTGFDDNARREYIRKAVVGDNEEAIEHIRRRLYENSVIADLCQVPLIFVMVAHMAHDMKHFMKFTSVTQFFKYMIMCFHENLKRKFKDTRNFIIYIHETEHHELDKIAFEGLNKQHQQLSWNKIVFQQKVGREFYDQYISIGILIEEQIVSGVSLEDNVLYTTEVRFYHKVFCEWYAAHHLVTIVTLVKTAYDIADTLMFLDPFDLQYLYRFTCGLHPDAGKKLMNHLKSLPGGDTFAILCALEQTGDFNEIIDAVKEFCSRDVKIQKGDSALLQRSTTQLLEIASNNNIPISCLNLEYSSIKFEGDTVILHSGISLPKLPTVEKIHITGSNARHDNRETLSKISYRRQRRRQSAQYDDAQSANQETLTEMDILNLFRYGMKCQRIKELMFGQLHLPTSISPEAITNIMRTRNIRVQWRPFDIEFHLDLQNGHWEVVDTQVLENLRSSTVSINDTDRKLQLRSTVHLLNVANNHNIPISCLHLEYSAIKFEGNTIILKSGVYLPILLTVENIHIAGRNVQHDNTKKYRGISYEREHRRQSTQYDDTQSANQEALTEKDILNLFCYAMKSRRIKGLMFDGCMLPLTFSSESIPEELQSRNIKVCWSNYGYILNLQSGLWKVCDLDTIREQCRQNVIIYYKDSELLQRCIIKLLENASNHDIPISVVYLEESFSKIDAGDVILHSGLRLSCPVSVKKIDIETDKGREMTETEVVGILMFVQQSHMLEKLGFRWCLLPQYIPADSIPSIMKSRIVKVTWLINYNLLDLNLQSGRWMYYGTRMEITDTAYNDWVTWFRDKYRDTEWQKARISSESESEIETESQNDNEYNK